MIEFHYEAEFRLKNETKLADWVGRIIESEEAEYRNIDYIFCTDDYLLQLNKKHLKHNTFTDIITFDYSSGSEVSGDIFISIDRVRENAETYESGLENELLRVMAHGLLHLLGYQDKTDLDKAEMRKMENEKIKLFHVEQ